MSQARNAVYESAFDSQIKSLFSGNDQRADHFARAVEWALCRERSFAAYPLVGHISNDEVRLFKTDPTIRPCLVIAFRIDAKGEKIFFVAVTSVLSPLADD